MKIYIAVLLYSKLLLHCARNKGVAAFLGSERSQQLSQYEKDSPGQCDSVFRSTCPWDTAGITTLVMKLMVNTEDPLRHILMD
jgi:hypothetical protein